MSKKNSNISLKILLPLLAAIVAISPLAIDMYLPAMPQLVLALQTNIAMVQNSLSIYLVGYSVGLLLFGPLADKYSRRALVIFGIVSFIVTTLAISFVESIEQFLLLRFVQAFVVSAATVVVPGTIREFYQKDTAKGLSYVSMIMMLAPMVAPTIGSALLVIHNWQLIFYVLAGYGILILWLVWQHLPEVKRVPDQAQISFLKRYQVVFAHKKARLDLLTSMIVSLAFFAYITAIPFVYLTVFKVSEFQFSMLFATSVLALMVAHFVNTRLVARKGSRKMLGYGLVVALITVNCLLLVSILDLPLFYTVITIVPLMGSISMIAVNADALVLNEFAQQSGTATAVIGTLRFGIGSLAGPILTIFYDGTTLPFALLMWTSLLIVCLCQLVIRLKSRASIAKV